MPNIVIQPHFVGYAPDVVTSRWDDFAVHWETGGGWVRLYDKLKASAHTSWDVLQFGYGPTSSAFHDQSNQEPTIAAQMAWCETTQNGFFDTRYALGGDYTTANANGYMQDGVHQNALGVAKINQSVMAHWQASNLIQLGFFSASRSSASGSSDLKIKPFPAASAMWHVQGGIRVSGTGSTLLLARRDDNPEDPVNDIGITNDAGVLSIGGVNSAVYGIPAGSWLMRMPGATSAYEFYPSLGNAWKFGLTSSRIGTVFTRNLSVGSESLPAPTITGIYQASAALDFPEIAALGEQTLTLTVPGCTVVKNGVVQLGWSAALEAGVIVKQARVSADATASVTLSNITASPINPAPGTCRAAVIEF